MSTKGALGTGAAGHTPPANLRATRSNTKATMQKPTATSQLATIDKKKAKARETEVEARRILTEEGCLSAEDIITHHTLPHTLTLLAQKYDSRAPPDLIKAMRALAMLATKTENPNGQFEPVVEAITQRLGEHIEKSLQAEMAKMSTAIKSSLADQGSPLNTSEALTETITNLKQVASEMSKTINEATTVTTHINDTALNYKQALLQTAAAPPQPQTQQARPRNEIQYDDAAIALGIDKKARQILLDSDKGEDNYWNTSEIREKAMKAMNDILPAPPQGTEIQEVIKLRKGSLILQFTTKEAADWLRKPDIEAAFTKRFDSDTTIRDRTHPIMVPRIPLTFDPSNPVHLREVEEANGLTPKTIKKTRWIKPEYRRAPGQSCAHAIFTIASVTDANRMIKEGVYICNTRTFPKKLKFEPKQCMKCRKWGHYAAECRAEKDACGTCGGQHRTKECKYENKRYCVSCRSDTHASWDRKCPEFLRKCDEYSNFHPENNLVYFPTDEDWTMTTRPFKIPLEDKFPTRFNVCSLPLPNQKARLPPTRPIGKKSKRRNNNNGEGQAVIENFFTNERTDTQSEPGEIPEIREDESEDEYDTQLDNAISTMPANFLKNLKT